MREKQFLQTPTLMGVYRALEKILDDGISEEEGIYHYTSTEVLDKILSNACFRASNIYYLNDAQEYYEGLNRLEAEMDAQTVFGRLALECIHELKAENRNTWEGLYTISFSSEGDSLQSWITYAKESGVCIEFNKQIMMAKSRDICDSQLKLIQKTKKDVEIFPVDCTMCIHSISYKKAPKMSQIQNVFETYYANATEQGGCDCNGLDDTVLYLNKRTIKHILQLLASFCKVEEFYGEREMRLSFFPLSNDEELDDPLQNNVEIKYQLQKNGILRPYINIFFFRLPERVYGCPITAITVGPSGQQQAIYDSVVHRLTYGQNKLWKYSRKELEELLGKHLSGCLDDIRKHIKMSGNANDIAHLLKEIVNEMVERWSVNTDYSIESCDIDLNVVCIKLGETSKVEKVSERDIVVKELADKISLEYYLSPEGILVKKSKIPYIF